MKRTQRPIQFKQIPNAVTYKINGKVKKNRSFGFDLLLDVQYRLEGWFCRHESILEGYIVHESS